MKADKRAPDENKRKQLFDSKTSKFIYNSHD